MATWLCACIGKNVGRQIIFFLQVRGALWLEDMGNTRYYCLALKVEESFYSQHIYKYNKIGCKLLSQNTTKENHHYKYARLNHFINQDLGVWRTLFTRHSFLVFKLQVHVIIFIILIIIFIAEYSCIIVLLYVRP